MLSATKLVSTGTVSLIVVIASVVPVFETSIVYVTTDPSSNTSDVLVAVFLVSKIGLTVSLVFFPFTTATLRISFTTSSPASVSITSTVKESVTLLFVSVSETFPGTSTTHNNLPFSSGVTPFVAPASVSNFVPFGIISDTLTSIVSVLLFVTVISYLILLPTWTVLSASFAEFTTVAVFSRVKSGLFVGMLVDIPALASAILDHPTLTSCSTLSTSVSIMSVCVYSSFGVSVSLSPVLVVVPGVVSSAVSSVVVSLSVLSSIFVGSCESSSPWFTSPSSSCSSAGFVCSSSLPAVSESPLFATCSSPVYAACVSSLPWIK